MTLQVEAQELATVRTILRTYVPGIEVRAFGSRVHGRNLKKFSDLDLVVMTDRPLDALQFAELKDAFSDSALSFKVDLLDWSTTNESFRQLIDREYFVVRLGGDRPSDL